MFGTVTIHQPVAFGVLTFTIVLILIVAAAFAAGAPFARQEYAPGWIVSQGGIAQVYAPQGALIESVVVRTGQVVTRGEVLASLSTDTFDAQGATSAQQRQQLDAQQSEYDAQISAARNRLEVFVRRSEDRIRALEAGAATLAKQRRLQVAQLGVAQKQFEDAAPLVAKGFISGFDQDRRRQDILGIEQAIGGTDRQLSDQAAQIEAVRSDIADAVERQAAEQAQLRSAKAGLRADRIGLEYRTAATLRAPVSGVVAAVNNRAGETARSALAVVSIAPRGELEAELLLPTRAAGLVRRGQRVRLYVDAFPYQRYGALEGVVDVIGHAAVSPAEYLAPISFSEPSYRIRVRLRQFPKMPGRVEPRIEAGMTIRGSIVVDRRTILQWITDPMWNP